MHARRAAVGPSLRLPLLLRPLQIPHMHRALIATDRDRTSICSKADPKDLRPVSPASQLFDEVARLCVPDADERAFVAGRGDERSVGCGGERGEGGCVCKDDRD